MNLPTEESLIGFPKIARSQIARVSWITDHYSNPVCFRVFFRHSSRVYEKSGVGRLAARPTLHAFGGCLKRDCIHINVYLQSKLLMQTFEENLCAYKIIDYKSGMALLWMIVSRGLIFHYDDGPTWFYCYACILSCLMTVN